MNFRRKRVTNNETGEHYRVLDVTVVNTTNDVDSEKSSMVVYSDKKSQMYFTKEASEFASEFSDGWIAQKVKETVEDVVDTIEDIAEAIGDKVEDVVDAIKDKFDDDSEEDSE